MPNFPSISRQTATTGKSVEKKIIVQSINPKTANVCLIHEFYSPSHEQCDFFFPLKNQMYTIRYMQYTDNPTGDSNSLISGPSSDTTGLP